MPNILLSYRRSDSAAIAGRIRDRLALHFGEGDVFMDIDDIPIGVDFRAHIARAIAGCKAMLVIIGEDWRGRREDGSARIMDARDPVRIELESALKAKLLIIPVLVDDAAMPDESGLPESLSSIAFINAAHVDSGRDFTPHIDRLIRGIEQATGSAARPAAQPLAAATVVPPPAPPSRGGTRTSAIVGLIIVLTAAFAIMAAIVQNVPTDTKQSTTATNPGAVTSDFQKRYIAQCQKAPSVQQMGDCACQARFVEGALDAHQRDVILVLLQANDPNIAAISAAAGVTPADIAALNPTALEVRIRAACS